MTKPTATFQTIDVTVGYPRHPVLSELAMSIETGSYVALVGPNGSGKSTLLRTLGKLLAPRAGVALLDGADLSRLPAAHVATRIAVVSQGPTPPEGVTVAELVEQGRFPHRAAFRSLTATDRAAIDDALEATGMAAFADRFVDRLSGGERQRAWFALALAQQTDILLLDEPTTFLDVGHQFELLELIDRMRVQRGLTIVVVLHDLNQAARFCDRMVMIDDGRVVADGPPQSVLTEELLARHFGVEATIGRDERTGCVTFTAHASLRAGRRSGATETER